MKSFILTILLAIGLLVGSTLHTMQMRASAEELITHNQTLIDQLNNDDFNGALASVNVLHRELHRLKPFFATLGNHDEINVIEQNLAEVKCFAEGEQKYDAIAKAYVISFLCENLPKNLELRLENIF